MQVESYKDKEGKNRNNTYVLVEDLEYLQTKKDNQEKNEFNNLKVKTEVQQTFDYDSSDLPF